VSHYAVTQSSGVSSSSRLAMANVPPAHLPSNIDDMRSKSLREIEAEVIRLRQLVVAQHDGSKDHISEQGTTSVSPQPPRRLRGAPQAGHSSYYTAASQQPLSTPGVDIVGRRLSPQPDLQVFGHANARGNLTDVQHRHKLQTTCVTALGAKTYSQIYAYYSSVPTQLRDPQRVVNIVQDRSLWAILPMVDEVVQLDRSRVHPTPRQQLAY
jgi:hypothetical protein